MNHVKIPTQSGRMLHDFAITENYIILPDLPLEWSNKAAFKDSRFVYQLNPKKPAMYGIMNRNCSDSSKMMWFELPYHYCFHYANAWEE